MPVTPTTRLGEGRVVRIFASLCATFVSSQPS
jgi:hypothetical protein